MPLTKAEKQAILTELNRQVPAAKAIVFVNYAGTTVKELTELRDTLAHQGLTFTVTKNTLLKKTLDEAGYTVGTGVLDQPVGVAIDPQDEVQPAKLIHEFSKQHEQFTVLGALVNGTWYDAAGVASFAKLPSRDQLLGQVVGTVVAPLSGFVNVLAGNLRGLVSVLKQYEQKVAGSQ